MIDITTALKDGKIDMAIVDLYSLINQTELLKAKKLKIVEIKPQGTGVGFALSGIARVLGSEVEGLLMSKGGAIAEFIAEIERNLPVRKLVSRKLFFSVQLK